MTTPKHISLSTLEEITQRFSVDSRIGKGGYADVHKGIYEGRDIAVKLLHVNMVLGHNDQLFINEVGNHFRAEHENIVQFVGYCYETKNIYVYHDGAGKFREHIYKVICSEYLQGGSLHKRLYEQSFAPDWSTRYKIIKGICEGLNYLHNSVPQILHLDLKPANVLLDSSMQPKVADLGLSRLFTQSHTHVTENIIGTRKYMAPEFINGGEISAKNDIFSLGVVMIDIMTAPAGYSNSYEMGDVAQLTQQIFSNWSTAIEATSKYPRDEKLQVQKCIELAICCVESEKDTRPSTTYILDALNMTETNIPKKQLANKLPCLTVGPSNTECDTLENMIAELENIANEEKHCNFTPRDNNVQQVTEIRETTSVVEEEFIIGRTEEKQEILSILSGGMTKKMVILPIYGIGGIGKTTLAQLVFNDTQFQGYSRVWIYVSEKFDLNKIGNSIISQLTNMDSNIADNQRLHERLKEVFADKSILIVLDDMWEKNPRKLDGLNVMLRLGHGSKVIVVTTRDKDIANKFSGPAVKPYKLEVLSDGMCWTIVKQKSFFEYRDDRKELEQIGRDIAIKCGGVALAAQSLGYMLRNMNSDQWESVRNSSIWTLSTRKDPSSGIREVLASLLLTYTHMPDWLKLCFTYCAVFPKGHLIAKYDLIHQWIALRFTEQSDMFDTIQLCEAYVEELLGMSFLQYSKKQPSSDGRLDKDVILFTMHDLVHDLARAILAHQINDKGNAGGNKCRYALLTDCTKPLQLSATSPASIKALHFLDCGELELCGDAFSRAMFLHILDLSECLIQKLPDSIGQLTHLRFLHAPRIQDQMIPDCITELSELHYLSLRGSRHISVLPESIGDMKRLMHLDLSGCLGIRELPVSFVELKQLVHLDLSDCRMSISEALGGFTKLQHLNLSVELSFRNNHIRRWLPEVIRTLIKLRYLNISGCLEVMDPSEDQIRSLLDFISTLCNLEHLDLSENRKLTTIPESIGNLRKLHTLDLSGCFKLEKLPDSLVKMVSLKVLNLDSWHRFNMSSFSRFNFASLPHFVVHASGDECTSNIMLLQPTNPGKLTIAGLENVKSAEEAQHIKLIEMQKIQELGFGWTLAAARFVDDKELLEKLVPPSSVKTLYITGYQSVSIPNWLMGIRHYLPNLSEIYFYYLRKCNYLPPLSQLPYLRRLSLSHMESLEEWNTTDSSGEEGVNELMLPMLERLCISQCPKLRILPCLPRAMSLEIVDCDNMLSSWEESSSDSVASSLSPPIDMFLSSKLPLHQWRLLHKLPALSSLTIDCRSDLTTSPEILKHLSSLESLSLRLRTHVHALPRWLGELASLQKLEIMESGLEKLDGNARQLTQLQSLCLSHCTSMTSPPQWLGELASLKKFEISDCKEIRSLPNSIQQLNNLKYLEIRGCPKLEEWCESEENKMKLAHIREVCINGYHTFNKWYELEEDKMKLAHIREKVLPRSAKAYEEDIDKTFLDTSNSLGSANGSSVDNEDVKDVPDNSAASVHGTVTAEVHPDLYSAVMNMPGFAEEALLVALSHLMDNDAQGSAYVGMQEEQRVSWLINYLKRHY